MSAWFSAAAYRASVDKHLILLQRPPATDAEFMALVENGIEGGLFEPHTLGDDPGFLVLREGIGGMPLDGH